MIFKIIEVIYDNSQTTMYDRILDSSQWLEHEINQNVLIYQFKTKISKFCINNWYRLWMEALEIDFPMFTLCDISWERFAR